VRIALILTKNLNEAIKNYFDTQSDVHQRLAPNHIVEVPP
jgi:hypothetical protein